jgi:hypothetical protein
LFQKRNIKIRSLCKNQCKKHEKTKTTQKKKEIQIIKIANIFTYIFYKINSPFKKQPK